MLALEYIYVQNNADKDLTPSFIQRKLVKSIQQLQEEILIMDQILSLSNIHVTDQCV